jgi:hypothetical protein
MGNIPKFGVFMGMLKSYEESKMSEEFYEENDRRMNIIGQNGNDGLHYDKIADSDKVINIVVEGGMVVEVNGLPVGWQYYIDDRDCPPEIEDE